MPLTPDDKKAVERVSRRVDDLVEINKPTQHDRRAIRAVMNGGPEAVAELLGGFVNDQSMRLPVANMVLSAGETLGQKLGRPPTTKTEPPNESDSDRARNKADKRRRIVSAYDENDKLHMMLPQIGRWLPGYAFAPIVVAPGRTRDGKPIPTRQLRDPFSCMDTETEVLTKRGWLRHNELTTDDEVAGYDLDLGMARWTNVHAVNEYDYDGELVAVDKRDLSMRLTPNHRCVVQKKQRPHNTRGPTHVELAENLTTRYFIPRSAEWVEHGEKSIGVELAALLGWVAAEGHYHDGDRVYLCQSLSANAEHVATIDRLLASVPEYPADTSGRVKVRKSVLETHRRVRTRTNKCAIANGHTSTMVEWALPLGLSQEVRRLMPDKQLGMWMLELPEDERRAALDAFVDGDGHRHKGHVSVAQRRRESLEVLQAIAVTLGYKTSLRWAENRGQWRLHYMPGRSTSLRHRREGVSESTPIPREHYKGTVWCPTTGTGTFYARRDGYVFITGNSLPGEWTANQAPDDIAFVRRIGSKTLKDMIHSGRLNPPDDRAVDKIESLEGRHMRRAASGGGVLLSADGGAGWANQGGIGIEIYEYLDVAGSWWVVPEVDLLLNFLPNPLKGRPAFRVGKRFAFSSLVGQYDRALGVLAAQARLMLLMIIATEDSVFAPTVITGDLLNKQWRVGRNAVNKLAPGSTANKLHDRVAFEGFQQMNQLQGELRQATSHPQTEDGISPMSFVTGRGINELASSLNEEVREYQTIIADLLMETDSLMLEYDEKAYGSIERTVTGVDQKAAFTETYVPKKDIKSDYRTRRIYGAMAGLDELNKIAGILNLRADQLIDRDTAMENIDGLENLPQIKDRVKAEQAESVLFDLASALGQQGDPRAIQMLTSFLPDGEVKDAIEELFGTPEEAVEEQAAIEQAQGPPPLTGEEDLSSILARITGGPSGGNATVGTQVMG